MSNKLTGHTASLLILTLVLLSLTVVTSSAQKANKLEVAYWRDVLRAVKRELKQHYYDLLFTGSTASDRSTVAICNPGSDHRKLTKQLRKFDRDGKHWISLCNGNLRCLKT